MRNDANSDRESDDKEEARLPDEAVVMRGGLSTAETLHKNSLAHYDEFAVFAISVRSIGGLTADDLARMDPPLAHPRFRETTVGELRVAGYDVIPDEPPPAHALIMLPQLPADDDYIKISALLSDPRENPVSRKERNDG